MKIRKTLITAIALLFGLQAMAQSDSTSLDSDSTLYVKTLPGAYLNSSCGGDRLGGNKIGFIPEEIVLEVIEDTLNLYKVALSEKRYAYIPKEYTTDTLISEKPGCAISGSISIRNSGKSDKVSIALTQRRPFIIREEINPKKFIIELYGVNNNSNWVTQYANLQSIADIDIVQSESDVVTLTMSLKHKSSWGYSVKYEGQRLEVDIKHTPKMKLKGMVIGIDAGHGGESSSGAIGRESKVKEKDLNLDMAHRLKRRLEMEGAKVVLSRKDDSAVTMSERKDIFKENEIDLMVSIHCNAGGKASGTSTYYKHIQYKPLAETILQKLLEIKGVNLFGLVGNFNFSLNAPVEYPTVLVETLFLSHAEDEAKLNDPNFRELMMKKVAEGLKEYLKKCKE